jgi:hypothetical protein
MQRYRAFGVTAVVIFGLATAVACGGSAFENADVDGGAADGGTDSSASEAGGSHDGGAVDGRTTEGGDSAAADAGRVPTYHRPDDSQCSQPAAAGDCTISGGTLTCHSDAECTTGTNGRCIESGGGAITCLCTYDTCTHDTDCPTGDLCACHGSAFTGGAGNTCKPGNCRVDSDCGPGGYCSPSHGTTGCGGLTGYYCHTTADTCVDDTDCSGSGADVCAWSMSATHWECQQQQLCP